MKMSSNSTFDGFGVIVPPILSVAFAPSLHPNRIRNRTHTDTSRFFFLYRIEEEEDEAEPIVPAEPVVPIEPVVPVVPVMPVVPVVPAVSAVNLQAFLHGLQVPDQIFIPERRVEIIAPIGPIRVRRGARERAVNIHNMFVGTQMGKL